MRKTKPMTAQQEHHRNQSSWSSSMHHLQPMTTTKQKNNDVSWKNHHHHHGKEQPRTSSTGNDGRLRNYSKDSDPSRSRWRGEEDAGRRSVLLSDVIERLLQLLPPPNNNHDQRRRVCVNVGTRDERSNSFFHHVNVSSNNDDLSLTALLQRHGHDEEMMIPRDFDLLMLSSDSNNAYWILHDLWSTGQYFPRLVCTTYNIHMPNDVDYVPPFQARNRQEQVAAASIKSLNDLAQTHGYESVVVTDETAIFVQYTLYQEYLSMEIPDTRLDALRPPEKQLHYYHQREEEREYYHRQEQYQDNDRHYEVTFVDEDQNQLYTIPSRDDEAAMHLYEEQPSKRHHRPHLLTPSAQLSSILKKDRRYGRGQRSQSNNDQIICTSSNQYHRPGSPRRSTIDPPDSRDEYGSSPRHLMYSFEPVPSPSSHYCRENHPEVRQHDKEPRMFTFDNDVISERPPSTPKVQTLPSPGRNVQFPTGSKARTNGTEGNCRKVVPQDRPVSTSASSHGSKNLPVTSSTTFDDWVKPALFDGLNDTERKTLMDQICKLEEKWRHNKSKSPKEALETTTTFDDWVKPALFDGLNNIEREQLIDQILKLEQWRNTSPEALESSRQKIVAIANRAKKPTDSSQTTTSLKTSPDKPALQSQHSAARRHFRNSRDVSKRSVVKRADRLLPSGSSSPKNKPINTEAMIDSSFSKYAHLLDNTTQNDAAASRPENKYLDLVLGSKPRDERKTPSIFDFRTLPAGSAQRPLRLSRGSGSSCLLGSFSEDTLLVSRDDLPLSTLAAGSAQRPLRLSRGSGSSCLGSFSGDASALSVSKSSEKTPSASRHNNAKPYNFSRYNRLRVSPRKEMGTYYQVSQTTLNSFSGIEDGVSDITSAAKEAEYRTEKALKSIERSMAEIYLGGDSKLSNMSSLTETASQTLDNLLQSESSSNSGQPKNYVRKAKNRIIQRLKSKIPDYVPSAMASQVLEKQISRAEEISRAKDQWYFSRNEVAINGPSSPSSPQEKAAWFWQEADHAAQTEDATMPVQEGPAYQVPLFRVNENIEFSNNEVMEQEEYIERDCEEYQFAHHLPQQTNTSTEKNGAAEGFSASSVRTLKRRNLKKSPQKQKKPFRRDNSTPLPDPSGMCYGASNSLMSPIGDCKRHLKQQACDVPDMLSSMIIQQETHDDNIGSSCFLPDCAAASQPMFQSQPSARALDPPANDVENQCDEETSHNHSRYTRARPSPIDITAIEEEEEYIDDSRFPMGAVDTPRGNNGSMYGHAFLDDVSSDGSNEASNTTADHSFVDPNHRGLLSFSSVLSEMTDEQKHQFCVHRWIL